MKKQFKNKFDAIGTIGMIFSAFVMGACVALRIVFKVQGAI